MEVWRRTRAEQEELQRRVEMSDLSRKQLEKSSQLREARVSLKELEDKNRQAQAEPEPGVLRGLCLGRGGAPEGGPERGCGPAVGQPAHDQDGATGGERPVHRHRFVFLGGVRRHPLG